ncbi:right-handed parallel beta-helix repeat-containing protein [uncultured Lamprocystis sp.]|jgi:hypothetical protein|uniref:right-handed parallel beta-helix repeat-containing protein n=1 Tax=uncultured Lamprocystis sp. TaxID=543132 RepID=UPI0025F5422F|nr:right-handed parallel beta-helix repeat-containing protein [uncultured Lamprocystis sp.]
MIDREIHTCSPSPRPLVQAIRACLGSRAITQTTSAAGLALLLAVPLAGSAADFTVTNRNDAGLGNLRQAVRDANASPGPDTILFDSSVTGTILLTSGALTVTDPLTLEGPGRDVLMIDGAAVPAILQVEDSLSLAHLKLANAAGNAINVSLTDYYTTIRIRDSSIEGSTGSGIFRTWDSAYYHYSYSALIENTTITGNGRHGIDIVGGTLSIKDSTFSGNSGNGIDIFGADLSITDSLVSGNAGYGVNAPSPDSLRYSSPFSVPTIA